MTTRSDRRELRATLLVAAALLGCPTALRAAETAPPAQTPAKAAPADGTAAIPDDGNQSDQATGQGNGQSKGESPATTTDGSKPAAAAPKADDDRQAKPKSRSAASQYDGYVSAMDWSLDFRPGPLRLFTTTDGTSYWYFTYRVINRTGKDRMWAPNFELFTDQGAIKRSGRSVTSEVTKSILALLRDPLIQDQYQIIGELRIGEENAKDGLVVWPADDMSVTEFTVFVTGASGKVRKVPDPRTNQPRVERWTIRFNYLVPGDPASRGSTPVDPVPAEQDVKDGADRRPNDIGVWLWR